MTIRFDPPDDSSPDDPIAARLRAALRTEAHMIQTPDDGLQRIRSRTAAGSRPWWQHPAVVGVAAAAVLGVAAGGAVVALTDDGSDDSTVVAGQPSSSTTPGSDSPSPTPSAPPSSEAPTPSAAPVPIEGNVYVYYVMDDGTGARLYREERPNIGMDPVTMALSTMLAEPALDPDYSSPWPEGTSVLDYSVDGDTATVDLSDFVSVGAQAETAAVQQLVYTVTANDKAITSIRVLVDGEAPPSGHSDWSEPLSRAPMVDVQGLVWVLGPAQGATVSSPVQISGYGTAFEATVSWEVRREGSEEVVAEGFTEAGANGDFAEFTDTVALEPGAYEIRAFESSAEDGSPLHVDSKTFTVE